MAPAVMVSMVEDPHQLEPAAPPPQDRTLPIRMIGDNAFSCGCG